MIHLGATFSPTSGVSNFTIAAVSFSSTGDNTVVAAVAGRPVRIFRLFLVTDADTILTFKNGTTALTGGLAMAQNGGITFDLSEEPWFYCTTGNAFVINQSGTANIGGQVWWAS